MISKLKLCLVFTFGVVSLLPAAIIGTNTPAQPLTAERIASLPVAQQPVWKNYLARSVTQLQADQLVLQTELKQLREGVAELSDTVKKQERLLHISGVDLAVKRLEDLARESNFHV